MSNPNPTLLPSLSFDQIVKGNVDIKKIKNKKKCIELLLVKLGNF